MERSNGKRQFLKSVLPAWTPKAAIAAMAIMPLAAAAGAQANALASTQAYSVFIVGNDTGVAQSQFQIILGGDAVSGAGSLSTLTSGGYLNPFESPTTSASYSIPYTDINYTSSNSSTIGNGSTVAFGYTYI